MVIFLIINLLNIGILSYSLTNSNTLIKWESIVQRSTENLSIVRNPEVTYHIFYEFNKKFDLDNIKTICQLAKLRNRLERKDKGVIHKKLNGTETSYKIDTPADVHK